MSFPYIIWTMQRTGGTTLANLLTTLSEHPGMQHEPFNPERRFGSVLQNWEVHGDDAEMAEEIATLLQPRHVIKHCYELMPETLNRVLIEVSTKLGYRHIVLDRRSETDRILSLELARQTGAWGKQEASQTIAQIAEGTLVVAPLDLKRAMHHMWVCHLRRQELARLLDTVAQTPHVIYFEEVYSDYDAGRARLDALFDFLDLDVTTHPAHAKLIEDALRHSGQDSARIMQEVPNIDEVRSALEVRQKELGAPYDFAEPLADVKPDDA